MAVRAWCFTINNPAFPACDLPIPDHARYISWQREKGDAGTVHLQGYAEFSRPVRMAACKRAWPTAHLEPRRGTREQARDYTRKDDTRDEGDDAGPFEHGAWEDGGSGARNDLHAAVASLKAGGMKRVAEEQPTAYVKFSRGLRELQRELEVPDRDDDFVPRPWQKLLLDSLALPADDRTIHWVYDKDGNNGKSRLARHLCMNHGAILLEGRMADMAYMYDKQRIVIFDVTRAQADFTDHLYSFAEKLKNGMIVSTKYESTTKIFKPPHVVFFSNSKADGSKWTGDRIKLIDLSNTFTNPAIRAVPAMGFA